MSFDNVQQTVGRRRALEEEYTIRKKSRVTPHIELTTMDTFLHKVANKSVTDCDDEQLLEIFAYKTFEFTVS